MPEGKKLNLLGHAIRRDFNQPLQLVTFDSGRNPPCGTPLVIRETGGTKRKARPRLHWTTENMARAWRHIASLPDAVPTDLKTEPYDNKNRRTNDIIADRAVQYQTPFQGTKY